MGGIFFFFKGRKYFGKVTILLFLVAKFIEHMNARLE